MSDSESVNDAFDKIQAQYPSSKVAAAVFNPGGGFVVKPFLELTEEDYSTALKSQAYVFAVSCTYSTPIILTDLAKSLAPISGRVPSILPNGLFHCSYRLANRRSIRPH